ncbi:MAG TPA: enoyl-CoA hydratase-related protein [Chthoniobacterales bacterium]|nr:enoyl-CoA hydratase-related protein [Chthoniobacterales bacterium]
MPVVLVEKQTPQITVLTLNRPERRNALTIELMNELASAIENAGADPKQRVVVLRGAGKAFCTGLDLQEAARHEPQQTAEMVARLLLTLAETRLVTIAGVHGAAVAGGAGVMSACDFVIASDHTRIGYPEVRRGLVASLVMTFVRRQLRERDLRELLLASELINAERAREIGLVNRVVPVDQIENEIQKIIASVLQGAPGAITNSKRLMEQLWSTSVRQDIERALAHHLDARESGEAREGIAAFNEKRPPNWAQ